MLKAMLVSLLPLLFLHAAAGESVTDVVNEYCSTCHTATAKSVSGPRLSQFDAASITSNPKVWSAAYRAMQAGVMPPAGAPRPDRATVLAALADIEAALPKTTPPVATNAQIAARAARLLWNAEPDAALQKDAAANRLSQPAVLESHIRRMLADPRAQALVSGFFVPWLQVDALAKADPDLRHFPDYTPALRDAVAKETELFLLSQLKDNRDPLELWTAGYTFANDQLAHHYGLPPVKGADFRRVNTPPERRGLLGQASIHMITSRHQHGVDAAYTSPASRANWVLKHYLGVPTPYPFPGAEPVKPELPITPQTRTLAKNPCVTCHQNFFPLGYALEQFDPIGRWRTHDQVGPADASGSLVDGTPTNGVVALRQALINYPEAFHTNITERLLAYSATGSTGLLNGTPETLAEARQILLKAKSPTWASILAGVIQATADTETR